jgi:hypothetical protein
MVSRRDSIKRAGKFIGLAAVHFALFSQSFREGMLYEMEAREIVRMKKLYGSEIDILVDTARTRGFRKVQDHFPEIPPNIIAPAICIIYNTNKT